MMLITDLTTQNSRSLINMCLRDIGRL